MGGARALRAETLERRDLLSVTGIGSETFKAIPFTASGGVVSDYSQAGYRFHLTGTANLTRGTIVYDSVDHGKIVNDGATHGAVLAVNNGRYTATGKSPNFSGTWGLNGYTDEIVDQAGQLSGTVVVQSSSMQIPTRPTVKDSFKGTYTLENATLNTRNFALAMDLTEPGGTTIAFRGQMRPAGSPFDVLVTPTWNSDGTIDVGVRVPGQPHKTTGDDRSLPVTQVQVYWAQGTRLKSGALDSIPVYWNEASGLYTIDTADYPDAPAGATGLAFVTRFDGKTRMATLALPTVSIAAASVVEGDSSDSAEFNHAAIPVTLSSASAKDVTVSYTTFKDFRDSARPGVDYVATVGSIVIPAGQTQGQIDVPIMGDTDFERSEIFSVRITKASNANVNARRAKAAVTISNDDAVPSISITDVAIAEGTPQGRNGRTTAFVFTVTLSNRSYQRIKVNYATADGSATIADKDYSRRAGALTFNPGSLTQTITVIVKADNKTEEDEDFFVNLSRAQFAAIADSQGVGSVLNDDLPPGGLTASRDAALKQLAGVGGLVGGFDPLGQSRSKKNSDTADSVFAAL